MTEDEAYAEAQRTGGRVNRSGFGPNNYRVMPRRGTARQDRRYTDRDVEVNGDITKLPTAPCFLCGSRLPCKHRSE